VWEQTEPLLTPGYTCVVRSAMRSEVEVLRAVRDGYTVCVYLPLDQAPVDSLLALRPHLTDDELAMVARALGLGWP
jgi:hypothetical protein